MKRITKLRFLHYLLVIAIILISRPAFLLADYNRNRGDEILDNKQTGWTKTAIIAGTAIAMGLVIYFATRDGNSDAVKQKNIELKDAGDPEQNDSLSVYVPLLIETGILRSFRPAKRNIFIQSHSINYMPKAEARHRSLPNIELAVGLGHRKTFVGIEGPFGSYPHSSDRKIDGVIMRNGKSLQVIIC